MKVRKGFMDNKDVAHTFLPSVKAWGGSAVTLHGRSRQQRSVRVLLVHTLLVRFYLSNYAALKHLLPPPLCLV